MFASSRKWGVSYHLIVFDIVLVKVSKMFLDNKIITLFSQQTCFFGVPEKNRPQTVYFSGASFMLVVYVFVCCGVCQVMGEEGTGLYRRFLRERKRSVEAEVAKAHKEYEFIVGYLQQIMQQVFS